MKYILCPLCGAKLEKQARFEKVPTSWREKHGEPSAQIIKRCVIGNKGRTEKVIEKPQGNGEKRYTRYYCKTCRIGWRYADTIKYEIKPSTNIKITTKRFKELLTII